MKMLVPDYYFETVYDIPLALLEKEKIRCLLLDIDNTLVPYDEPDSTEENRKWFDALSSAGIRVLFVSNNSNERVARFAEPLGIPYAADAGKPGVKKYRALAAEEHVNLKECAAVGDQIFTDVLAASRLGVKSILVRPIKNVETNFFRFKRFFEKPFVRAAKKRMQKLASAWGEKR